MSKPDETQIVAVAKPGEQKPDDTQIVVVLQASSAQTSRQKANGAGVGFRRQDDQRPA